MYRRDKEGADSCRPSAGEDHAEDQDDDQDRYCLGPDPGTGNSGLRAVSLHRLNVHTIHDILVVYSHPRAR